MIDTGSKDDRYDVPDSTDWLGTPLASIAPIDASLRCQVCKEFYNTPMITSCSHTFCSLCIRRCLANDGKCPACRASEQENRLRSNWAIEGLVDEFLKGRRALLTYAQSVKTLMHSPRRTVTETGLYEDLMEPPRKKTRHSSRVSARLRESKNLGILDEAVDRADDEEDQHNDDLAACPVCDVQMKLESIDSHLNKCLNNPAHEQPTNRLIPPTKPRVLEPSWSAQKPLLTPGRLPQLNYSLFKEAALRKKLLELGISAQGSRQILEKRHTEWITLWNANCDSSRPLNKRDLLHNLEVWERTQGLRTSSSIGSSSGSQILQKDFDGASWAAKHEQSFQDLITIARKRLASKDATRHSIQILEQHNDEKKFSKDEGLLDRFASPDESTLQALPIPTTSDITDHRSIKGHSQDVGSMGERTEHQTNTAQADL